MAETNTSAIQSSIVKEQGYDETPYTSYPFDYNRPEHLNAVGKMFSMDVPNVEKARVLEIGGADGANLMRFATDHPESYCLGVDLSKVQIEKGQKRLKELGIKNYDLKHMSITDLDDSVGTFDYIICHGVFSWVPEQVREAIFAKCKKHLSKNGLVFVSYNSLPGWNMANTIRELMMYHTQGFADIKDKVAQARHALQFIVETLKDSTDPYSGFMKKMAEEIQSKQDHYIRHEYLAEENEAFYFHDFIKKAQSHGFNYLSDTDVQRMYAGNLPPKAAEKLGEIKDIVRTEQYIDFIRNSLFRCTVLCHNDVLISRDITNEKLSTFYYSGIYTSERALNEAEIYSPSPLQFFVNGNESISVTANTPALKAVFDIMIENVGNPLKVDEIATLVIKKYSKFQKNELIETINSVLARLIFAGYIKYYSYKPKNINVISAKPKLAAFNTTRFEDPMAEPVLWLTTQTNQMITLDEHIRFIISHINGKNSIADLEKITLDLIKEDKLNAQQDGKAVTDEKALKGIAKEYVQYVMNILKNNFLLVD